MSVYVYVLSPLPADSENYGTLIAEQINREFSNTVSVLAHGLVDERNSLHRVLQRLLEVSLVYVCGGEGGGSAYLSLSVGGIVG